MARQQIPVSAYDNWLKSQHDAHTDAAANVDRIDRDIAVKTAELDALFAERVEQVAIRDHSAKVLELDPREYRERAKHGAWQITKHKEPDNGKERE